MTPNPDSPDAGADQPSVGDQNVQRLLSQAYDPEVPDPAFAERVRQRMRSAARLRREAARPRLTLPGVLIWAAAAAAAIVALGILLRGAMKEGPRPGEYVMESGERPTASVSAALPRYLVDKEGLTARPRPPAEPVQPVAVGSRIETQADQRRRVVLPDGSVLYVNRSTSLQVEAARHVRLAQGEVYVEVAPPKPDRPGGTFTVSTATRTVSALGTRFAVRVDSTGTNVAVTQGEVGVSG
ncbi:MAG: hypothetical protein AMJ81_14650 [Phycisphaerae bacterium SM23_33]|nr:MAG: hypothetical protein AMJ81_14650 [Phycisphaerae bacterium SM23_33]